MEVAGLVLGAVPLILYALDNYGRAWKPAKDFYYWKDVIPEIKRDIFLQKVQLSATLANLDLTDPTMDEVEMALQKQCPDKCEQFMDILKQMDNLVNEVMRDLGLDEKGQPKWAVSATGRVEWEWDRVKMSFRRGRRKEIVKQLQNWNAALRNSGLEKREISLDSENRIVELIRRRFDDRRTSTIRANAIAVHKALKSGLKCTPPYQHKGNIELNWHSGKIYSPTNFSVALSMKHQDATPTTTPNSTSTTTTFWKTIPVSIEEVVKLAQVAQAAHAAQIAHAAAPASQKTANTPNANPTSPLRSALAGQSKQKRVVHWFQSHGKESHSLANSKPAALVTGSSPPAPQAAVNTLMPSHNEPSELSIEQCYLCSILKPLSSAPQDTLKCIPIPESAPNKQLRIDYGQNSPAVDKRTVHLNTLLSRTSDITLNRRLALARKQRFGIAAALTWSVLYLCDSPWLGKALKNDEIQLFLENQGDTNSDCLSNNPYLSYKFSLPPSAPGPLPAEASPPPTESEKFQSNQIRNMTLFTLAIRLIELGQNKSFNKIKADYWSSMNVPDADATDAGAAQVGNNATTADDFEIAKSQITELYLDPGMAYGNATDRCLRFLFPGPEEKNTFDYPSFRRTFFTDVVAPVQATFELIPGSCSELPL